MHSAKDVYVLTIWSREEFEYLCIGVYNKPLVAKAEAKKLIRRRIDLTDDFKVQKVPFNPIVTG